MSIEQIVRAYAAVEDELARRDLLEVPEPPSPILEHVVGRTVLYRGSESDVPAILSDQGYRVLSDESIEATEQYDTVIVHGRELSTNTVQMYEALARYALILSECTGEGLKERQMTDGLHVVEKYTERPTSAISIVATVGSRIRTTAGWDYRLSLADGFEVRAVAEQEYPRGTAVLVACSGAVVADNGTGLGLLGGEVLRSIGEGEAELTSSLELLVRAESESALSVAHSLESGDFVSTLGIVPAMADQARRALRGFVGTGDEAVALLRTRLPEAFAEPPLELEVRQFTVSDEAAHAVVGVVLEPETPYGPNGVWFPAELIRTLAATTPESVAALNHSIPTDCRITLSMIDEAGAYAKPGSWIIGCELPDELYEAVKAGTYRGFSIKGLAIVEGED